MIFIHQPSKIISIVVLEQKKNLHIILILYMFKANFSLFWHPEYPISFYISVGFLTWRVNGKEQKDVLV